MMVSEKKKPARRKRGRPVGSKTKPRDVVRAEVTRCRKCGSDKRTAYANRNVVEFASVRCLRCPRTGRAGAACACGGTYAIPFSRIVLRRTACLACGQARLDKYWET